METLTPVDTVPTVTLELEGPRPQRRATVGFRLILVVPHFLYAIVLTIVVFFAVVAAWFAALVVGRMPEGLGTFISRVVQYLGRVQAYGFFLLTDRYPPFALDAPDYPVSVLVPRGGRLNRAAVFCRLILLVPAGIVVSVVTNGVFVCIVFVWLIVLVAGRMPRSLFEAIAAVFRYELRFYAFAAMLTSEYPRGLFGDRGLPSDVDAPVPAVDQIPPMESQAAFAAGPLPRITKLVLSKAAKRILVLFIVVGVVFTVATNVLTLMRETQADRAREAISLAYDDLYDASVAYSGSVQACAAQQAGLPCLRDAALRLQGEMAEFRTELAAVKMPAEVLPQAQDLDANAAAVIETLGALATAPEPAAYGARATELQQRLQAFDSSYTALDRALILSY